MVREQYYCFRQKMHEPQLRLSSGSCGRACDSMYSSAVIKKVTQNPYTSARTRKDGLTSARSKARKLVYRRRPKQLLLSSTSVFPIHVSRANPSASTELSSYSSCLLHTMPSQQNSAPEQPRQHAMPYPSRPGNSGHHTSYKEDIIQQVQLYLVHRTVYSKIQNRASTDSSPFTTTLYSCGSSSVIRIIWRLIWRFYPSLPPLDHPILRQSDEILSATTSIPRRCT